MFKIGEQVKTEVTATVVGRYDVIVCGGGTAGCVAAIAAVRNGASVVLIESDYFLGGMMSAGNAGLTKFILHGKDTDEQTKIVEELRKDASKVQLAGGIPLEITHRLLKNKAAIGTAGTAASYVYTDSQEFKLLLFEMMVEAGVKVLLHSPVCDLLLDGDKIIGVVTQTKTGRLAYLGDYIIDSTGDGDIAALAGVPFELGVGPEDAVYKQGLAELGKLQEVGSMFRIGGVNFDRYIAYLKEHPEAFVVQTFGQMSYEEFFKAYENGEMIISRGITPSGYLFQVYNYPHPGIMVGCIGVGGTRNVLDVEVQTRAEYDIMIAAKTQVMELRTYVPGFEDAYVLDTPRAGIRETRHILGEYKLNVIDILTQREFEDTIGKGCHPVDIYPMPKEIEELPQRDSWYFNIPYRCLVAYGIQNLLMAGRCISSTREAAGCTRPTVPCMITGEAAGTAAALCKKSGIKAVKDVDIASLRAQLISQGARI